MIYKNKETNEKADILLDRINMDINKLDILGNSEYTNKVSDGAHTFGDLYYHRMILTSALFNIANEKFNIPCYKSKKHSDGTMFDGFFVVYMESPIGQISYHYEMKYWDLFPIEESPRMPEFDGHTSSDAINRIYNLFVDPYK